MECEPPALLRLPQELRDEIYKYIILEQDEISLRPHRASRRWRTGPWTVLEPRYCARISNICVKDGCNASMSVSAPLGQVNRQLRSEMSDFIDRNDLRIVARVHNFDFKHVLRYLTRSEQRLQEHIVPEDNLAVARRLNIELSGPYDERWRENLTHWLEGIEALLLGRGQELGTWHKVVASPGRRWKTRTPLEVVQGVCTMRRRNTMCAGQVEKAKIWSSLTARWNVEEMLSWHWSVEDGQHFATQDRQKEVSGSGAQA